MNKRNWNRHVQSHSQRLLSFFFALGLLLTTASCGLTEPPRDGTLTRSASKECFNTVRGAGDLEVTNTGVSTIGENTIYYAIEITNTNTTHTLMAADVKVAELDKDGEPWVGDDGSPLLTWHQLQYLAPGESQYVGYTFTPSSTFTPVDVEVELPSKDDESNEYSYWLPHEEVDYPTELEASNITVESDSIYYKDGIVIGYDITNSSNRTYKNVRTLIVLYDANGKLLVAAEHGAEHRRPSDHITIGPGKTEDKFHAAFPKGLPPNVDDSQLEIDFVRDIAWNDIDQDCVI